MIEDIEFLDTDEKISVTIDNETQDIPIQKIKKFRTYIGLNKTLNTALHNDIVLDASIYYGKDIEDNDIEDTDFYSRDVTINGPFVTQQGENTNISVTVKDIQDDNLVNDVNVSLYQVDDIDIIAQLHADTNIVQQGNDVAITTLITDTDGNVLSDVPIKLYSLNEGEEFINDNDIYLSRMNRIISTDGTVTITIYNDKDIYYSQNVHFQKGHILDNIVNKLPLGEYRCVIEYSGNKYFQPSTLDMIFLVEKRLAKCTVDNDYYYGDLQERIIINGQAIDNETGRPINNCSIKYEFDGITYDTATNENGAFSLDEVVIPEADYKHCNMFYKDDTTEANFEPGDLYEEEAEEAYIDEDGNVRLLSDTEKAIYESEKIFDENGREITVDDKGNIIDKETNEVLYDISTETDDSKKMFFDINGRLLTINDDNEMVFVQVDINEDNVYDNEDYPLDLNVPESYPNVSYPVSIIIDNDSYYSETTETEVIVNKAETNISISSTNIDKPSNKVTLVGQIIASYLNMDEGVKYGKVNISFPDFNYSHPAIDITNGGFETDINLNDVYDSYNKSDIDSVEPYNTVSTIKTNIEVFGEDLYNGSADSIINKGDAFTVEARVTSVIDTGYITDGMLTFVLIDPTLSREKRILYRYSTEIDNAGNGSFTFNTTKDDKQEEKQYKVYVKYTGMFGYEDCTSNEYEIRLK